MYSEIFLFIEINKKIEVEIEASHWEEMDAFSVPHLA